MRSRADRDKQEGISQEGVEAQQKAMGKVFVLFRIVIAILAACALVAMVMAYNI